MGNLLSAISGQFSKSLILGTFLPIVVFVIAFRFLIAPLLPSDWLIVASVASLDTQGKIIAISFITILLTGLIYNLNIPLIRIYEGYPWKSTWIGSRLIDHHRQRMQADLKKWDDCKLLYEELQTRGDSASQTLLLEQLTTLGQRLDKDYPSALESVLPTRLGNVIRSFESYPKTRYGIATITVWTRLIAKLDKDYAGIIDSSKASFDFMINGSVLSLIMAIALLLAGLLYPIPFSALSTTLWWIAEVSFCLWLAISMYQLSIGQASAWGETVKSGFDLYRFDLMKQLGFTTLPKTISEERQRWSEISGQILYGDRWAPSAIEYSPIGTFAYGTSQAVQLEIARGISPPINGGLITVTVRVRNVDAGKRDAEGVHVTDAPPDNYYYIWNTAYVNGKGKKTVRARVLGAGPYRFHLGTIKHKEIVVLTYNAFKHSK